MKRKIYLGMVMAAAFGLCACSAEEKDITGSVSIQTESGNKTNSDTGNGMKEESMEKLFGENCIEEQIFEVELSEYSGKVYFVPFAPSDRTQKFYMRIMQEGKVLTEIQAYVPEKLQGEAFGSLDAVSFYDVNYDGNTDIVLIETYGNTSFAAVYYGYAESEYDSAKFIPQETLSDAISNQVSPLSIPEIRSVLSDGKKNGSFTDYQEAYEAAARLCQLEDSERIQYNLIYVDGDEVPELAAGVDGYYTSLYTYQNGTVYTLMDRWPYGAMGNAGYEYSPKKNSLRNYNSDFAGAIMYTTYMTISSRHVIDTVTSIETYNFDDANRNGIPDEDEMDSLGRYSVSYIDGVEVSAKQCKSYDMGGYEYITVTMRYDELIAKLGEK